jgi:hypothetical protein
MIKSCVRVIGGVAIGGLFLAVDRPLPNGKDTPPMKEDSGVEQNNKEPCIEHSFTDII